MKVMIELPDNWLDADLTGNLEWITTTVRETIKREVRDKVVSEVIKNTKLPTIEVTEAEIKDRVLTIMAERSLDELNSK